MRLFIASPARLYDYTAFREEFSSVISGKWVEEENLHLTWYFLGEQSSAVPYLKKLRAINPLRSALELHSIDSFGHPPRILFARSFSKELFRKAEEFGEHGFVIKHFKPHVTLCRIKKIEDWKEFRKLKRNYFGQTIGEIMPEIILYRSVLTSKGPIYEHLTHA